jgi:tryptophan-rich sensory protein
LRQVGILFTHAVDSRRSIPKGNEEPAVKKPKLLTYLKLFCVTWVVVYIAYFITAAFGGAFNQPEGAYMSGTFVAFMLIPVMTTIVSVMVTFATAVVITIAAAFSRSD